MEDHCEYSADKAAATRHQFAHVFTRDCCNDAWMMDDSDDAVILGTTSTGLGEEFNQVWDSVGDLHADVRFDFMDQVEFDDATTYDFSTPPLTPRMNPRGPLYSPARSAISPVCTTKSAFQFPIVAMVDGASSARDEYSELVSSIASVLSYGDVSPNESNVLGAMMEYFAPGKRGTVLSDQCETYMQKAVKHASRSSNVAKQAWKSVQVKAIVDSCCVADGQRGTNGPYVCKECGKEFKTREGFTYHVRNNHVLDLNWVCYAPDCEKKYARQYDLRVHLGRVHGMETEHAFSCGVPKCTKSFSSGPLFKKHLKDDHGEIVSRIMQCGSRRAKAMFASSSDL